MTKYVKDVVNTTSKKDGATGSNIISYQFTDITEVRDDAFVSVHLTTSIKVNLNGSIVDLSKVSLTFFDPGYFQISFINKGFMSHTITRIPLNYE